MHEVTAVYLDGGPSKQNEGAEKSGAEKGKAQKSVFWSWLPHSRIG